MITAILTRLSRHTTVLFAAGMVVALIAPPVTALVGPGLPLWIFGMLTLSVLRTDAETLAGHLRRPGRAVAVILWMLVISPLVVGTAILYLDRVDMLPVPDELVLPLLFYTAMPPLTAVPALALLFGIDAALAVLVLVGGSLLTPLILPPMALLVLGLEVDISVGALFQRLAALIFGSFIAGVAIRRLAGAARIDRQAKSIDGLIVIVMVLIVVAVFDGVHATLLAEPGLALASILVAFFAAVGFQIFTAVLFLPFGLKTALTAGMLSGNRNQAILIAVLGASATPAIILFVALAQLPVYLLPMIQRPLAKRFGFVRY